MSIPKVIHYCWFGKGKKNDLFYKCLESWKKYCPDYKIFEWNEENYKRFNNDYVKDAYKEKKWAFVSDYVRLDVIYKYGGIYLDTDVELIRTLDKLLSLHAFIGVESYDLKINTGLGFGAEKNNENIKRLRDMYDEISFYESNGELNLTPCPEYVTSYFERLGYKKNNRNQLINGVSIFSSQVFSPYNYDNGRMEIDTKTFSIHWYNASWFDEDDKAIHDMELKIRSKIDGKIGKLVCYIYRKSYRLIKAIERGQVIELFSKKLRRGKKENV